MERKEGSAVRGQGAGKRGRWCPPRPRAPDCFSGFKTQGRRIVFLVIGAVGVGWFTPTVYGEESLDARRARVERMDPDAKAQLFRRLESFRMMPEPQQERLRRIHEQLEHDPQGAELREVMQRYYAWLKTLKPYQKAELAELAPRERVERIKRLQQEQARREGKRSNDAVARAERLKRLLQEQIPKAGKRLNQQDVEGLLGWLEPFLDANEALLVAGLPIEQRQASREQLAQTDDPDRRREMLAAIWLRSQLAKPNQLLALTTAQHVSLCQRLSPSTRQRLESLPEPEQQRLLAFWIRLMLLNYTASHHLTRLPGAVSDAELGEFLEHKLNPATRDWLLSLPPEEMQRELWAQYLRSKLLEPPAPNRQPGAKPATGSRPGGKKAEATSSSAAPKAGPAKGAKSKDSKPAVRPG